MFDYILSDVIDGGWMCEYVVSIAFVLAIAQGVNVEFVQSLNVDFVTAHIVGVDFAHILNARIGPVRSAFVAGFASAHVFVLMQIIYSPSKKSLKMCGHQVN